MATPESPFDPDYQNTRSEARVTVALERISEAFRVMLWQQGRQTGLSPVQLQVLVFILHHPSAQTTVTYIAAEFNMTGATVSDSVRVLVAKNLLERKPSSTDARSHLLALTNQGREIAQRAAHFANALTESVLQLSDETVATLQSGLVELIGHLHSKGVVSVQRMCFNCRFHGSGGTTGHYCHLLERQLALSDLRIDCPEHVAA